MKRSPISGRAGFNQETRSLPLLPLPLGEGWGEGALRYRSRCGAALEDLLWPTSSPFGGPSERIEVRVWVLAEKFQQSLLRTSIAGSVNPLPNPLTRKGTPVGRQRERGQMRRARFLIEAGSTPPAPPQPPLQIMSLQPQEQQQPPPYREPRAGHHQLGVLA